MDLDREEFLSNFEFVFSEFFEGPPAGAGGTVALDRDGSWRHTLERLTAAEASRPAFPGATTVVAHVVHATYYLTNSVRYIVPDGDKTTPGDWSGSWATSVVTESEWQARIAALFAAYEEIKATARGLADWSGDSTGLAFAVLAHSAYHLGAVRQLVKALKASQVG